MQIFLIVSAEKNIKNMWKTAFHSKPVSLLTFHKSFSQNTSMLQQKKGYYIMLYSFTYYNQLIIPTHIKFSSNIEFVISYNHQFLSLTTIIFKLPSHRQLPITIVDDVTKYQIKNFQEIKYFGILLIYNPLQYKIQTKQVVFNILIFTLLLSNKFYTQETFQFCDIFMFRTFSLCLFSSDIKEKQRSKLRNYIKLYKSKYDYYVLLLIFNNLIVQMSEKQVTDRKRQLISTFQNAGLQDALKKQMRMKIIQKLQNFSPSQLPQSFQTRVIVSLVSEYFVHNHLLYSNSVFLPDAGYQGRTLNRHELCSLTNITQFNIRTSILEHIINRYIPLNKESGYQDKQVQTYDGQFQMSIEQKFNFLEDQYRHKLKGNQSRQVLDMAQIRRQIELQFKQQYDRDIRRFKEFQIESVKINEREKARKKYEQYSLKIQDTYKRKIDDIRKQSSRMYDQEQSARKQKDYYATNERSMLGQQRQLIRMKEMQIQQKSKLLDMTKHLQVDNTRRLQQQLSVKIKEYDTLNLRAEQKINYEVGLVKLSLQKEYQDKQLQFLQRKKAVDQQYSKMQAIKESVSIIQRENSRLVEQNIQLRKQLQGSLSQITELISDNKQNLSKIDALKGQRQLSKEQIRHLQQSKANLSSKLHKLQHQLTITRKELDQTRSKVGRFQEDQQEEQIKVAPEPISKRSPVDDLFKKMDEISKKRRRDIEQLKQPLDE